MRDLHLFQMIQNEKKFSVKFAGIFIKIFISTKIYLRYFRNFGLVRRCWKVILRINCFPPSTWLSISRVDYIHRPTLSSTNSCFCQMRPILCHRNPQNWAARSKIWKKKFLLKVHIENSCSHLGNIVLSTFHW